MTKYVPQSDDVGKDLKDKEEAHREGAILASVVGSEITKPAELVKELHFEIENETGGIVGKIRLDPEPSRDAT